MKQYYNTNDLKGDELDEAANSNARQQDLVMIFFQARPGRLFATFQVRAILMPEAPHTSVQRCMTNLTDLGILEKTDNYVIGPYKKQVHTWRFKPAEPKNHKQMTLF